MLIRYAQGERAVGRAVHVPAVAGEEERHLPRDLATLKQARARTTTRLKGVRSSQGVRLTSLRKFPEPLDALRLRDGAPMPSGRRRRVLRVWAHHALRREQIAAWAAAHRAWLQSAQEAAIEKGRQLMPLQGIGLNGAWVLGMACFAWRECKNRREVGG
jgi:transposase